VPDPDAAHREDLVDDDKLDWIDGYRVVFHQLACNWDAFSPDLDGVVSMGKTREEVARNRREAISVHLAARADDRRERPWLYQPQESH
jgi:predicted RNase H-like HicB family nuclease